MATDFRNIYSHGFARVASCAFPVALADPVSNADSVLARVRELHERAVAVALFPELSLTGYSLDDLFLQDPLLDAVDAAIVRVAEATADLLPVVVIGAPLRNGNRLYNCAVIIHRGRVLGVAPKSYLPNYREFYEKRSFAAAPDAGTDVLHAPHWPGADEDGDVPFGADLLFRARDVPGLVVHVEVCEDMWVPVPPSSLAALAGATVLLNMSASPITVARAEDRHLLARATSARCNAAYVYAASMAGESTTDLSWDGMTMVYEAGELLGQTERFLEEAHATVVDVDLDRFRQERFRQGSFHDNAAALGVAQFRTIDLELEIPDRDHGLCRTLDRFPFVPDDESRLALDCYEAYNIQVSALEQRMRSIGAPNLVIGVSGGLDSTHALIVAAKAMDRLGRPRSDILAFTMPGFGTSARTKENAIALSNALGVTLEEVDIRPMATQMLRDLGHPYGRGEEVYDVTFENVQAGLRTDYLFRAANQRGGIVVGTGDLSELALGWCTYGVGDQMSHYGVNAGVPKTLMQHLIRWVISTNQFDSSVDQILESILGTVISPELVPTGPGEPPQSSEAAIGPYPLQDFTLFHVLRRGARPAKIAFLAEATWANADGGGWPAGYPADKRVAYDLATIKGWMRVFYRRFFSQQFKRSAMPNGPKVSSGGSLSPRGDWRMPSDALANAWLAEVEAIPES